MNPPIKHSKGRRNAGRFGRSAHRRQRVRVHLSALKRDTGVPWCAVVCHPHHERTENAAGGPAGRHGAAPPPRAAVVPAYESGIVTRGGWAAAALGYFRMPPDTEMSSPVTKEAASLAR
jgi:hypothetical protein